MRFGREALGPKLEGAILAHTYRLSKGGALKKGRRLSLEDIERLKGDGATEVTVAQLEDDDVHEDDAALAIASLLKHPSVNQSPAHTGRVNLHANESGVMLVERSVVDAINSVSEEVTVATLEPFTVVRAKMMVATVKIIPFAVSASVLKSIEKKVDRALNAVTIHSFRARAVGLILSQLPGMSSTLLRKASEVQRARVTALGGSIARELRCDHDPDSVANAIHALREEECDPILILGASAIVDRRDVIPDALERAGGAVEHLGMPVDPGNLLMLGRFDDTTVLGLPGCARSLNPSGFDFVLQRLMADLDVTPEMVAGLGVGGLLKEIPSRPQPRSMKKANQRPARVAGVILAAGMSRRMGEHNKLLLKVDEVSLVRRVALAMERSKASPVVVVVGHEGEKIRDELRDLDVVFVENPDYALGMSTSLKAGVRALGEVDAAVVGLADMPWVTERHVDALVDSFDPQAEATICVPIYGRKRGNPVLWSATHFPQLTELDGDVGGKVLLERFSASICYVAMSDASVNVDVDTPEALAALARIQPTPDEDPKR